MMSRARSNILETPRTGLTLDRSTYVASRGPELPDHSIDQIPVGRQRICEPVFKTYRLPLERTHLMERLHFDPLDVLHRRDKSRYAVDIRGIIGFARDQRE